MAPNAYAHWFLGQGEAEAELHTFDETTRTGLHRLMATGVTEIALQEYLDRRLQEREASAAFLQAAVDRAEQAQTNTGRLLALMVVVALIMGVEAWAGPTPPDRDRTTVPPALGRLVTVRYALVAVWLALALAEPTALLGLPWTLIAGLILVGLIAGFIPLGKQPALRPAQSRDDNTP